MDPRFVKGVRFLHPRLKRGRYSGVEHSVDLAMRLALRDSRRQAESIAVKHKLITAALWPQAWHLLVSPWLEQGDLAQALNAACILVEAMLKMDNDLTVGHEPMKRLMQEAKTRKMIE